MFSKSLVTNFEFAVELDFSVCSARAEQCDYLRWAGEHNQKNRYAKYYKETYREGGVLPSPLSQKSARSCVGLIFRSTSEYSGRFPTSSVYLQTLRTPDVPWIVHVRCSSWTVRDMWCAVPVRTHGSVSSERSNSCRRGSQPERIWFEVESSATLMNRD